MDIYLRAKEIDSQKDFVKFIEHLGQDFMENRVDWENDDLGMFVNAIAGYCSDKEFSSCSWKDFAEVLLAARVYE